MKAWNVVARAGMSALLATGMVVSGCETRSGGGDKRYPDSGWVAPEWDSTPAPRAAAPAPQPRREPAPAPAPAPRREAAAPTGGDVMYLPTGDRASSALSIRCGMPRQVTAGNNFDYTVEVCNLTAMELQNVVVTYTLDGARVVSAEPAATGNGFAIGNLPPRGCRTIKLVASAAGTGQVRGCLGATWNNSLCCATNVVQPALRVVKTVTPAEGTPCDSFTYTLSVTNTGTGSASNVRLADTLPQGLTMAESRNAASMDLGSIAAGQTVTRTFSAKAARVGGYTNFATATADGNLTARSADVAITVRQPVLTIAKVCPGALRVGQPATFRITVTNTGDAPAANTKVEDTLPGAGTFVSATEGGTMQGGKVVWNLGTMAPRASRELGVTVNVAGQGTLRNTATVTAVCAEAATANCEFSVQGSPDLGTLLTDDEGVVRIGDNQVYRYEVENQGQVDLTNVTVVVTMPAGVTFVSSTAPKAPAAAGNKLTFTGVTGVLKSGEKRNFTLTLKSSAPGEKLIVSETTCDQLQTPVRDDELTFFVER